MNITAFGHALETIHDGLTVFAGGRPAPVPLVATAITVDIVAGLATVRTTRRFANTEDRPIEAILTMPIGFDAVVTGVKATVDGRVLVAVAKPKAEARDAYEGALDAGKLAVLHEEVLRGVHALSVGNLGAGKDVTVEIEAVMPLSAGAAPFLRIPVTVGQLYGASPFAPVDDLVTSAHVRHDADVTVTVDAGQPMLGGRAVTGALRVTLDAAVEIVVQGGTFGAHRGVAADGRQVRVDLRPVAAGAGALDLAVLVDHSGSTGGQAAGPRGLTIWETMRDGLRMELGRLRANDAIALWQFDDTCDRLGDDRGPAAAKRVAKLRKPAGGTELDGAVKMVLASGARDILVLTDGQTWSATVDALAGSKARISAILVGAGSLDANIGQLCAMTGGQVFYAAGDDVAASLSLAFATLRRQGAAVEGRVAGGAPEQVTALRGGVEIGATWSDAMELRGADAVGRYAAALALPLLDAQAAEYCARAHGLCTHRTSLILIDEAEDAVEGMAQQRKVRLMACGAASIKISAAASVEWHEFVSMELNDIAPSYSFELEEPIPSSQLEPDDAGLLFSEAPLSLPGIQRVFGLLRWDLLGDALLAGDLTVLDTPQAFRLQLFAAFETIRGFAARTGGVPDIIALAVIADCVGGPLGQRFARRVFKGRDRAEWADLRLWDAWPDRAGRP